jgi:CSLREA domain-containing protein
MRNGSSIYEVRTHIERASNGVGIGNVSAVTSYGTFPMNPVGGGEWQAMVPLNQCVNGFDVRFEATWSFLLAGNIEREPAFGVHQKWLDGDPPPACGMVFGHRHVVNSTEDLPDATPGDGECAASSGVCTLRAAIMEANAQAGQDRIELGSATYELTRSGNDDDAAAGDLDITDELAIVGNGAAVDGGDIADRVFDLSPVGDGVDAEFRGLSIREGASTDSGGGVRSRGRLHLFTVRVIDNEAAGGGGGIMNDSGFVEMLDSHIADNSVNLPPVALGGGLHSSGERPLIVIRASSFVNNASQQHGGGLLALNGRVEIRDSTFSGNRANVHGGGLFLNPEVSGWLRNLTVTENVSDADISGAGDGAGIMHGGGSGDVRIANSVVAANATGGNTNSDCSGILASAGGNLIGVDTGCAGWSGNDEVGTAAGPIEPDLGPLTNAATGTRYHTPSATSPALNAGNPDLENDARTARCTHVDQRGIMRPQGIPVDGRQRCDVGAIERQ